MTERIARMKYPEDKEANRFLREASAAITLVGGDVPVDRLEKMNVRMLLDCLYRNGLRLRVGFKPAACPIIKTIYEQFSQDEDLQAFPEEPSEGG